MGVGVGVAMELEFLLPRCVSMRLENRPILKGLVIKIIGVVLPILTHFLYHDTKCLKEMFR